MRIMAEDECTPNGQGFVKATPPSSSVDLDESLLKSSTPSDLVTDTSVERDARLSIPSRPAASFAALITEAINSSPDKQMVLSDIYAYIEDNYKYFKTAGSGWKNSVRHNLSLKRNFCKVPRPNQAPGKGSYWRVVDERTRILEEHRMQGAIRRNSTTALLKERAAFASRPRSSSQGSASNLPLIKPRPQFAYGYAPMGYGSWTGFGYQGYPFQSYPFTLEVPMTTATAYQQQPQQQPQVQPQRHSDMSMSMMSSNIMDPLSHFPTDNSANMSQYPITGHFPDSSNYFNDVWLGAGTPKQGAIDTVASPREYLRLSPENMGNSMKRSPQFNSFDSGL